MPTNAISTNLIPTNIIFGFLGAGKTTAILDLLSRKPDNERWAVLVNEFGEIGIDGKIFSQAVLEGKVEGKVEGNVTVKEVPGGCLCCVAGVPFQVGLTELVRSARPDRLIIEPTGLGHPKEIIKTLQNKTNQQFIALQQTITLVDPRKLQDERYLSHEHFIGQIDVADVLLANKADVCSQEDLDTFWAFAEAYVKTKSHIGVTQQGHIELEWLGKKNSIDGGGVDEREPHSNPHSRDHDHNHSHNHDPNTQSWIFPSSQIFNYEAVIAWVTSFSSMRLKAIVKTNNGNFIINQSDDDPVSIGKVEGLKESVVEVIGVMMDGVAGKNEQDIGTTLKECIVEVGDGGMTR